MVGNAVICHWVTVGKPTEAGMGEIGLTIIDPTAYLYANNSLVGSTQPERLQRALDVLTSLFERFGIRTNKTKTVGMVCQPCRMSGGMSDEGYARRTRGKGPTFQECQQRRVEWTYCRVEVAAVSLMMHLQIQHDVGQRDQGGGEHPFLHPPRRPRFTGYPSQNTCFGSDAR